MLHLFLCLLLTLLIAACSVVPTPQARSQHADALAASQGRAHDLQAYADSYLPQNPVAAEHLTVYLEGDGLAWLSPTSPSPDPTPISPQGLALALVHARWAAQQARLADPANEANHSAGPPAEQAIEPLVPLAPSRKAAPMQPPGAVAYLARPCQYADARARGCAQAFWTHARFAPDVIASTDLAIDALKRRFDARRLTLIGYSGGGAVAALVAARRDDVYALLTVAGNLDHRAWTRHHGLTPLSASLNPANALRSWHNPPRQRHFLGGQDRVVPPALARDWPEALAGPQGTHLHTVPDADHQCCWTRLWPELLRQTLVQP